MVTAKKAAPAKKVTAAKKQETGVSVEALKALGEELNEVVKPKPLISVENSKGLKGEIEEVVPMLAAGDKISAVGAETIKALGMAVPADVIVKEEKAAKAAKAAAKAEKGKTAVAAKKAAKAEKAASGGKGTGKLQAVRELIEGGKLTAKEIVAKVAEKFPESSKAGTSSMLSHGKSADKSPFGKAIKVTKEGILHF